MSITLVISVIKIENLIKFIEIYNSYITYYLVE